MDASNNTMEASTEADLQDGPATYRSSRMKWAVLFGDDPTDAVAISAFSEDMEALRRLLSQQPWTDIALARKHTIFSERRPLRDAQDVREVSARPISHLERIFCMASEYNRPEAVSALLEFASETEGVKLSSLFHFWSVYRVIQRGNSAVIEAMALVYPEVANLHLHHQVFALDCAVQSGRTEVVAVLLKYGARPDASRMRLAARQGETRIIEMFLELGTPVSGTGALHDAAEAGHIDIMHILLDHGADVNEILPQEEYQRPGGRSARWTPMHHAASRGQTEAMKLLESKGAQSAEVKDVNGRTPAQVLAEHELGKSSIELCTIETDASS